MISTQCRCVGYFGCLAWAIGALACGAKSADDAQPSGSGPQTPRLSGTAGLLQRFVEEEVTAHTEGYVDAAHRLAVAVMTGSAEGVTLNRLGSGRTGVIAADLDQDGTAESMLNVTLMSMTPDAGPTDPYQFSIGQGGPGMPSLSVGGTMQLSADGRLTVTGAYGSFEADYVTGYVKEGNAEVGPARIGGSSVAHASFDVFDSGYTQQLTGNCALEVVASGGTYRIKVTLNDNPETPANEAQEFYLN